MRLWTEISFGTVFIVDGVVYVCQDRGSAITDGHLDMDTSEEAAMQFRKVSDASGGSPMRFGSYSPWWGIDLGLERAGMAPAWMVEIDDYANRVLCQVLARCSPI